MKAMDRENGVRIRPDGRGGLRRVSPGRKGDAVRAGSLLTRLAGLAVLVSLLLAWNAASAGLVICRGTDGHRSVEFLLWGACDGDAAAFPAGTTGAGDGAFHCGPCVDLHLLTFGDDHGLRPSKHRPAGSPSPSVPIPASLSSSSGERGRGLRTTALLPRPLCAAFLRTTVLLI